jgi:trans-2,3-dihydro-3-hydroxyanthranilate isomerase
VRYVLCDVFTDRPLQGSPLCVFTDARGLDAATMQALAREVSLSESAFVLPPERDGHARVRIFGPRHELFTAHPALGTAFVLGGPLQSFDVHLEFDAGIVRVQLEREGARISFGWMTQPTPRPLAAPASKSVLEALGIDAADVALEAFDNGAPQFCITLPSAELVHGLTPDFSALARATEWGVGVFYQAGERCLARYFAPSDGVREAAATGSFASVLALSLFRRDCLRPGQVLTIEQGEHVERPSTLYARVDTSAPQVAVEVGGAAQIVARGQFLI